MSSNSTESSSISPVFKPKVSLLLTKKNFNVVPVALMLVIHKSWLANRECFVNPHDVKGDPLVL